MRCTMTYKLPFEYRYKTIMRNKLLSAEKDVKACRLAYCKPDEAVHVVFYDLHPSLARIKTHGTTVATVEPCSNFVDRRWSKNLIQKYLTKIDQKSAMFISNLMAGRRIISQKKTFNIIAISKLVRTFMAFSKLFKNQEMTKSLWQSLSWKSLRTWFISTSVVTKSVASVRMLRGKNPSCTLHDWRMMTSRKVS